MEESVDFDIHEALKEYTIDPAKVPTPAASSEVLDAAHDPELLTPALINSVLHPVIDEVAESPDAVFRSSVFDTLQCLLKCVSILLAKQQLEREDPNH
jgi:condensin complex subunit 1